MKRTTSSSATRTSAKTATAAQTAKPRTRASKGSTASVSETAIAVRAYEIFKARDGEPGDAVSDWLQAERELRSAH